MNNRLEVSISAGDDDVNLPEYFPPETAVTWDRNGAPLSRFKDDVWDYSSVSKNHSKRIHHAPTNQAVPQHEHAHFQRADELALRIRLQSKALLWAYQSASGVPLAFGTIYGGNIVIQRWASRSYKLGVSLFDLLSSPQLVAENIDPGNLNELKFSSALLKVLYRNRKLFNVAFDLHAVRDEISRLRAQGKQFQQTPLMPSRIYSGVLGLLIANLEAIEHSDGEIAKALIETKLFHASLPSDIARSAAAKRRREALDGILPLLNRIGFEPSGASRLNFLRGKVVEQQVTLIALVMAFTGMRVGEALNLPRECLTSFEHEGRVHWIVKGFTYKLESGELKETSWVTNDIGRRAVIAAQAIAKAVDSFGRAPREDSRYPLLFCGTESGYKRISSKWKDYWELLADRCPIVDEADLSELTTMQLGRDWELSGISVGKHWPLRTHQFRRALAVYAHRSGMVTLPSLKGQLQHITEEMTLYYSAGFQNAASLVFDSEHFSHEWNSAKAESSYFGYVLGLLLNDDEVFGGASAWARSEKVKSSPVSVYSRAHGLELFRRGELAYRETPLGGCTATEQCKSSPLEPIPYDCLESNCKNLVVFGKRLSHVIESQQVVVSALATTSPGSVEHRLEAANLSVLLRAKDRLNEAPKHV
ncbi:hypothetical protein NYO99_16370 [Pelomonas sp. UHG3]|uniref:Uncharacterized protein n=1 Tax=Roseateles hydrophilus TaxID=2975054 RepID=A0ACC6CE56_9BURK|nr:hypothetical protein [Pelomonas sp. UHG3]MCY4746559.1 hypothetical protein [Pelomonas sp. UHG3]